MRWLSYILTIKLMLLFSLNIAQTITGKFVDHTGSGLSGLQLKLYISPYIYETLTNTEGTFLFNNITDLKQNDLLPSGYKVSQNYPNPFNPKTRILVTLPIEGIVQINIYNTLGEKVLNEIEKYCGTGIHVFEIELNGLANGIYLARITIDKKYAITKKLMLIYGSQHILALGNGSTPDLDKTLLSLNSTQETKIDSIIVFSSIIGKKVFKDLPNMIGNTLNLGIITIERFCLGIPSITFEGKVYNTIQIGNQCWLRENLDIGLMIPLNQSQSNNNIIEKYCYNNDPSNCTTFGGLYQWNEAMAYSTSDKTKGICPEGWHIPSRTDFEILANTVSNNANYLKNVGQGSGTNISGFSGLFAGFRDKGVYYYGLGSDAAFWTSPEYDLYNACNIGLVSSSNTIYYTNNSKDYGMSIRCIKN